MATEATHTASSESAHAHKAPNYFFIWGVLLVLTLAEVGVAFLAAIPEKILIFVLLALAVWKALLVALYYMHLKFEPRRLWIIVTAPLPLILILVGIVLAEGW